MIERSYRWDEGDRLIETHDLARGMRRYQYDACEQLVGVDGDAPERFVFDPAGNPSAAMPTAARALRSATGC